MNCWPGTNIPKSTGNAFDWQSKKSEITKHADFMSSNNAKKYMLGKTESKYFSTYSKAKPIKAAK